LLVASVLCKNRRHFNKRRFLLGPLQFVLSFVRNLAKFSCQDPVGFPFMNTQTMLWNWEGPSWIQLFDCPRGLSSFAYLLAMNKVLKKHVFQTSFCKNKNIYKIQYLYHVAIHITLFLNIMFDMMRKI